MGPVRVGSVSEATTQGRFQAAYCPMCEREVLTYYLEVGPPPIHCCVHCDLALEAPCEVALDEARAWGYEIMEEPQGCGCEGGGCAESCGVKAELLA